MKERLRRYSTDAFDLYRTTPLGASIAILTMEEAVSKALRHDWFGAACLTLATFSASIFIIQQMSLRRRLEHSIEQHGYQERVFKTTVQEWCDRQTALVVARRHGVLPLYQKLCLQNMERMSLPFIPHF